MRLEEFDLPKMQHDEMLVKIMTDSVCMSTYKLSKQGEKHMRTPETLNPPIIVGHEMCGYILEVGEKWQNDYKPGQKFTIQPSLLHEGRQKNPGYYYPYYGGDCTYCIIPNEAIEGNCVIPFNGSSFFEASLFEPVACIIAGYKRMYHSSEETHSHIMGVQKGGKIVIFGACGPMGLECIDYALQLQPQPEMVVAVDISDERLTRAEAMLAHRANGVNLIFHNSSNTSDPVAELLKISPGGFDDAFVYAPIAELVEQADKVLADDGCLNFFAGPVDKQLTAGINMYNVHYKLTHIMGCSGSLTEDLIDALQLTEQGKLSPAIMVTHVGGLDSAKETTLNVPNIPGGKKLIYTHIDMPLTAIEDFEELGKTDSLFKLLAESCRQHNDCWNAEAESILLKHYNIDTTVKPAPHRNQQDI